MIEQETLKDGRKRTTEVEYISGLDYVSKYENLQYRFHSAISRIFNDDEYLRCKVNLKHDYCGIRDLIPTILYDDTTECFINESSVGFVLECNAISGASQDTVKTITNLLSSEIPEGTVVQVTNVASPKVDGIFTHYKSKRNNSKEIYQTLAEKRTKHFTNANWHSVFKTLPYIVRDFKIIITVSIPFTNQTDDNILNKIHKIGSIFKKKITNNKIITDERKYEEYETKIEQKADELRKLKQSFISTLKAIGIIAVEHKDEELIKYLYEIINPNRTNEERFSSKYRSDSPIANQVAEKDNLLAVNKDHISIYTDDKQRRVCVKSFNVKTYPQYFALWQGSDLIGEYYNDLSQIPCPFLTTFTIRIPHNISAKHARMQAKGLRAMQQSETMLAKFMPELKEKSQDFSFVNQHTRAGQKLVDTYFQITLFSSYEKLEEASQMLTSIYKKKAFQLISEKYMQLQSYMSLIPFNMSEGLFDDLHKGNRTDTMLTWTCSNLIPLLGESYGMVSSPCMMLFGRRGQPLFWNPFGNQGGNYNTAVVGKSGSGKSVFMQELVTSLLGFGGKVYVVDDGRSFMNSCKLQGGEFMEFVNGKGVCINPFTLLKGANPSNEGRHYNIDDVLSRKAEELDDVDNTSEVLILINTMVRQMARSKSSTDEVENSYISESIDEAYRIKGRNATITTVRDILLQKDDKRAKDIALMLRPFPNDGE